MLSTKRPSKDKKPKTLDDIKADVQGKNEKTKRLNAEIPESLHTEIFIYAKQNGMTMTALLTKVLREEMSK